MYNKIIMIGNLTRDIEFKYLQSSKPIAKSAIATSYKYKSSTGEQKEETCFLDFTIFGKVAEVANQYLKKGSKVMLEGRLTLEQWTSQDGTNRSKHVLHVNEMKMLGDRSNSSIQEEKDSNIETTKREPSSKQIDIDIKDEDIPF